MGKVYVYARCSTNEQDDSLLVQTSRGEAEYRSRFAKAYEWGGSFVDRGVSGAKPFSRRPQGFELHKDLERGDVVILTKLDRGFRSMRDFVETLERFEKRDVRLIVLDLGVDTGTIVGKLVANIVASVAEFERQRIAERTRDAIGVRKKAGKPIGHPPYGFKIVRLGGKDDGKSLARDHVQREHGRLFLSWWLDGWSLDRIYIWLLEQRIYQVSPGQRHGPGQEFSRGVIQRWIAEERRYQALEEAGVEVTAKIAMNLPRLT